MQKIYFLLLGILSLFNTTPLFGQNSYNISTTTVTDTAGYLYDDGGPTGVYGVSTVSTFTINVGAGKTLKLQWLEFNVETNEAGLAAVCPYDYVEVFDGPAAAASTMMYCGSTLPPNFEVASGQITVRFTSDGAGQYAGFKAYWTTGAYLPPPGPAPTGNYCPPSNGTPCDISWCKRVTFANIDNDNGVCDKEYITSIWDGYSDYTELLIQLEPTTQYQLSVTIGNSLITDEAQAWIDWNQDGVWDLATEYYQLVGNGYAVNLFTSVIVPPPTAVTGVIGRIRIITDFFLPGQNPCSSTYSGEIEDYSFIVLKPGEGFPNCVDYTTAKPVDKSTNNCLNQVLRWKSATSATSYLVTLEDTLTGAKIVDKFSTTDTFYVVPATLSPSTVYRWSALAVNGTTEGYMCSSALFTTSANQDPVANIQPALDTLNICLNAPFIIDGNPTSGTSPYTHLWTGTGSSKLSATNTSLTTFTSNATGNFGLKYRVTDANNCSTTDSVQIKVITGAIAGTISYSGSPMVCQGSKVQFKIKGSSGTVTLQDSISAGIWADVATTKINDSIYEATLTNTGDIFFRSKASGNNCLDLGASNVSISVTASPALPIVNLVGNDTICSGQSVSLVVSNYSADLVWNDAATTQNDTLVVSTSGTYSVSYTAGACPAVSLSTTILVAPNPVAAVSNSGALTSCADSPPLLFTSLQAGETVVWNTGATTKDILATTSGSYNHTITNAFGCSKTSPSVVVTINPLPTKPTITRFGSVNPCQGEPVVLTSSYSSGNSWSTGATSASITVNNTGQYFVHYTDSKGCVGKSDTSAVNFRPAPVRPLVQVTGKVNTCIGDSVRLAINGSITPTWNDANSTANNSITVRKNGNYFASFINADGCQVYSDTVTVTFTQFQATPLLSINGNLCEGKTVILVSSLTTGNTWNDANQTKNDSLAVTQSGLYSVVNIQNGVCVAYSDTLNVVFEPRPTKPSIYPLNDRLYSSVTGTAYQWISDRGLVPNSNSVWIKPLYTSNYQVIVYSEKGCASQLSDDYYIGFTSIEEFTLAGITVAPNPFNESFTIDVKDANKSTYTLTNALGQVVQNGALHNGSNSITLQASSGIYTLQITRNDGVLTQRIIKK